MFTNIPNKLAGSISEAFWLRPTCSRNQAGLYMPDPTSRIQFGSVFFQRRPGSNCAKPTRILSGWPGQFGANTFCPQASRCTRISRLGSGRTQPARCQVTIFRLGCVLPQMARIILCSTRPDHTVQYQTGSYISSLWLCQVFGQTDPVRSQVGVQESSGPLPANVSEPSRIGSGMFTGNLFRIMFSAQVFS